MDILLEINSRFQTLVVDKLDTATKEFIVSNADPAVMSHLEHKRMRKAVFHHVFGNNKLYFLKGKNWNRFFYKTQIKCGH